MLTLVDPLTIANRTVYRDHADAGRLYAMPARALVDAELPGSSLSGVLEGGRARIAIAIDLSVALPAAQLPPAAALAPIPFTGTATLSTPSAALGGGRLTALGGGHYAALLDLDLDGTALLRDPARFVATPLGVRLELAFEHRLAGVQLVVAGDLSVMPGLLRAVEHGAAPTPTSSEALVELLLRAGVIAIEVAAASVPVDDETVSALRACAAEALRTRMAAAWSSSPPAGAISDWVAEQAGAIQAACNFELDHAVLRGAQKLATDPKPPAELPRIVDRAVLVYAPVDFARLGIASVGVKLHSAGGDQSLSLSAGADRASAPLPGDAYDWTATVHYAGAAEPLVVARTGAAERALALDAAALGVLDVAVSIGELDPLRFREATVGLRYTPSAGGRAAETSLALSVDRDQTAWAIAVGEPAGRYQYKVDWKRAIGRTDLGAWTDGAGAQLRLEPPPFDGLDVPIAIPTGQFATIASVTLELRYDDPANQYTQQATFVLTRERPSACWCIELRDPTLQKFSYRQTIVNTDGTERVDAWHEGEGALPEMTFDEHTVHLFTLFDWTGLAMATVDLEPTNPSDRGEHARQSLVIDPERGSVELTMSDWNRAPYSVVVTYYSTAGEVQPAIAFTADQDVIVLPPPPVVAAH